VRLVKISVNLSGHISIYIYIYMRWDGMRREDCFDGGVVVEFLMVAHVSL
jgi:hypothetical protein